MSYQVLSLPMVAVIFISELVNVEKKEFKGKKKKYYNVTYLEDTLQGGNMYWQMD